MATDSKQALVSFERLQAFIAGALHRVGLPEADAGKVATLMAQADLQGSDGHGVLRLPQYVKRIRAGGMNIHPQIRVVHERDHRAHGIPISSGVVADLAAEIGIEPLVP